MSATPDEMTEVFSKFQHHHKIENVKRYVLSPTYDHINKLTFYYKDASVEKLLDSFKKNGNKAIVFCDSCKKAYSLYKKFCNDSLFLCSNSNSHYKYVDTDAIEKMLQDERFETQFLISTACFDAGANIIDKAVIKIIIDIKDVGSLIQCMGRKRIQDNDDKIDVYIIVSTKQMQEMLGIGKNTAYKLLESNMIKSIRIGRTHKIPKENIIAYLNRGLIHN